MNLASRKMLMYSLLGSAAAGLGLVFLHDSDASASGPSPSPGPKPAPPPKAPTNIKVGDAIGAPFTSVANKAGNPDVPFPFEPDTTMLVFRVKDASGMSTVRGQLIGYSVSGGTMSKIQLPNPLMFNVPREALVPWDERKVA